PACAGPRLPSIALGRRKANQEARAQHPAVRGPPVLRRDRAAVRLHDLPGDAEPEARVAAERLALGPKRIEAVEQPFYVLFRHARAFVLDAHLHEALAPSGREPDGGA